MFSHAIFSFQFFKILHKHYIYFKNVVFKYLIIEIVVMGVEIIKCRYSFRKSRKRKYSKQNNSAHFHLLLTLHL